MTDLDIDILEWTVHPVRIQPGRALLVLIAMLAVGVLVTLSVPDLQLGLMAGGGAVFFLFLTLNRFFLPSRYRLDGNGIAVRYPFGSKSLRWKDLRRFPHDQSGGYLTTRVRKGAFDRRGISVLFGKRGDEIIPRIKSAMELNQ
tara:strand:+ start:179 stop:610 length:432 start_codon:yes stop_codon:yes gene_type:complete